MTHPRLTCLLCVLALACGDDDSSVDAATDTSASDVNSADVSADVGGSDTSESDMSESDVPETDAGTDAAADAGGELRLFEANGRFDYQLGGDYTPPAGITIVSRDREGSPEPGLYNICYINGYQVQPGAIGDWEADLILRDGSGDPIIDPDWDEALLDISTEDKRTRIAAVVGEWITQCGVDGFDAIEIDNLDTYSRSGERISEDDAVALMALLSAHAHGQNLAIAQKNSAEIVGRRAEMGTDFAVVEECNRYTECDVYIDAYGEHVLMIEYRDADFTRGCGLYQDTHAIVRRDLNLVTPSNGRYVFDDC